MTASTLARRHTAPRTLATLASLLALTACQDASPNTPQPDAGPMDPANACEAAVRPLPIPFDYELASDHLSVATDGGPIAVMIGPWGAHVQPHTGHPEGNVKADWYGLWTPTRTSPGLVEVSWDDGAVTPGGCDPGARCGVSTSHLEARIPWYRFPADSVRLVRVELLGVQSSDPYDGQSWEVELDLCPYRYVLGHVGAIAPELADAMVAAGGIDPRVAPPVGVNLIEGHTFDAPAGMALARPQIKAGVIAENAAYRTGLDSVPEVPWAQIEWTANHRGDSTAGIARSEYSYMEPALREALGDILEAQAGPVDDFRYEAPARWLWTAELVLEATSPFARTESTGLLSGVGGWFQRPESGVCDANPYDTAECSEVLSIFPVHTEGAYYDPANYHEADVRYLLHRGRLTGDTSHFLGFAEILSPTVPDPTSGVLRVKWRHTYTVQYQAIAYRFDPATSTMRFRYGPLMNEEDVVDPYSLPAPAIPATSDACTASTLICMTQLSYGRF